MSWCCYLPPKLAYDVQLEFQNKACWQLVCTVRHIMTYWMLLTSSKTRSLGKFRQKKPTFRLTYFTWIKEKVLLVAGRDANPGLCSESPVKDPLDHLLTILLFTLIHQRGASTSDRIQTAPSDRPGCRICRVVSENNWIWQCFTQRVVITCEQLVRLFFFFFLRFTLPLKLLRWRYRL